jgi:hypothetical protein
MCSGIILKEEPFSPKKSGLLFLIAFLKALLRIVA